MIQLFPQYLEQIREQALQTYPNEAVWVVTTKGLRQLENVHEKPQEHFSISPADNAAAFMDGLLAVVHSHVNGLHYPSVHDMQRQVASGVPWGIVMCDGVASSKIRWWGGNTAETVEPLYTRTFCHGVTDCYAAVRDFYLVELGKALPEYPREWMWWATDADLIGEGFEAAGFSVVKDQPRPNDVWLAKMRGDKLNHCGVLLQNDLTYHHPGSDVAVNDSKKAVVEPIYRYLRHVALWVRHKDFQ